MKFSLFSRFFFLFLLIIGFSYTADAQKKPKSPPKALTHTVGDLTININYNAPYVKGRKIWGGLESYDEVWRTGANNATTFEINQATEINGQPLAAGKYSLFTIPSKDSWTFIFNKEADQWGAYNYKKSADALRVVVTPDYDAEFTEQMAFEVNDEGEVSLVWEKLRASFVVGAVK